MDRLCVGIMDLPNELIFKIWDILNKVDVLYSFLGVNKRFDKLSRQMVYTRCIDLVETNCKDGIYSLPNSILDRYCCDILPEINSSIECFILEPYSMERILAASNYSQLHKLILVKFNQEWTLRHFCDESPIVHIFKNHISHLVISIDENELSSLPLNLGQNIHARIFETFANLIDLDFGETNGWELPNMTICQLSSMSCFSSTIINLRIIVNTFDDCLCLLDGRLCQLSKFIITIIKIDTSVLTIDTSKVSSNLKYFSLISYRQSPEYDNRVVPLLRQMINLQYLTLYLNVQHRSTFIDGIHLNNEILIYMPQLQTFTFNIMTHIEVVGDVNRQSRDDIRRTFLGRKFHHMECYIDYRRNGKAQCHIYSLPYNLRDMHYVSNNFPEDRLINVRDVSLIDQFRPFEHAFFIRISRIFPFLTRLVILNIEPQRQKRSCWSDVNNEKQILPILEFPHLIHLWIPFKHIDYLEQFLADTNTRLPRLVELTVHYEDLDIVTENFTRDATRRNCAKVEQIRFGKITMVYSKNFYLYFPYLQKIL